MAQIKKCGGRIFGQWVTMNMCGNKKDHIPHNYVSRDKK